MTQQGNEELEYEDDFDELTDDQFNEMLMPVIIEAMIDGRLPCPDVEFENVLGAGLELGIVTQFEDGSLALSRDVEFQEQLDEQVGLALSQNQQQQNANGTLALARQAVRKNNVNPGASGGTGAVQSKRYGSGSGAGAPSSGSASATGFNGKARFSSGMPNHGNVGKPVAGTGVKALSSKGGGGGKSGHNPLVADAESRAARMKK